MQYESRCTITTTSFFPDSSQFRNWISESISMDIYTFHWMKTNELNFFLGSYTTGAHWKIMLSARENDFRLVRLYDNYAERIEFCCKSLRLPVTYSDNSFHSSGDAAVIVTRTVVGSGDHLVQYSKYTARNVIYLFNARQESRVKKRISTLLRYLVRVNLMVAFWDEFEVESSVVRSLGSTPSTVSRLTQSTPVYRCSILETAILKNGRK